MAKGRNPLFSLGARGTLAETISFARRRRQNIVEKKPIPYQPNSASQLEVRSVFQDGIQAWHALSAEEKREYETQARPHHMTGYAFFMGEYMTDNYPPVPPPPPTATETLRPNAVGDEENLSLFKLNAEAGHFHWEAVDDVVPDGTATTVGGREEVDYERDFYNIEDHIATVLPINHITVYARCFGVIKVDRVSLKIVIKAGTGAGAPDTPSESDEKTVTTDWANYSEQWVNNPATDAPWTLEEIDNLQIGISMRAGSIDPYTRPTYCTQVYVDVEYITA